MKISPYKKRILVANCVVIALILVVIAFIWPTFSGMFMPFFIAIILSYLLNPLIRMLERHGVKRGLSVTIVVLLLILVIAGAFMSFVPSLISNISSMVNNIPAMIKNLANYTTQLQDMVERYNASDLSKYFNLESSLAKVGSMVGATLEGISNFILTNSGQLMNLIIIPLVMIMLLADKEVFSSSLMYLIPIDFRGQVRKMFGDIDMIIGGFIRGQGIMSIAAGILTGVGAYFLGLPYATVIGVIAGITTMIPYFGPAVGMVVISIIALLSSPILMVYLLVWMSVVQVLCGNVIAPAVMSGDVGLHPVIIIFSIFFFGAMFGGLGMILAVPLMGTVRVVLKYLVAGFAQSTEIRETSTENNVEDGPLED